MRIRVEVQSAALRRGLVDLLESAGHSVTAGENRDPADLTILSEASEASGPRSGATLHLRPPRGARPADDPAAALRATLDGGPPAIWRAPLDPDLLLEVLGPSGGTSVAPPPAAAPPEPSLTSAPDAWLRFAARSREVLWASPRAAVKLVAPGGRRLSEHGVSALPPGVFDREEGREVRLLDGRPHLVVWWTDSGDRRCVGVVRLPPTSDPSADTNVETLAELGRVSATLAHEIRNPLASFAGALDAVAREDDREGRDAIVELARQRIAQMRRMLDDTLRLARPLRGAPEPVAAEEIVRSAIDSARTDPTFERLQLDVEVGAGASGGAHLIVHAEPLRQALLNLLVNAAQAQGGRGRVVVRIDREANRGLIRVEDEGPGFPVGYRDRAFSPFWTTKGSGTGLGLAFVKRVAEAAGGRARIEDREKGACVCLELPLAESG